MQTSYTNNLSFDSVYATPQDTVLSTKKHKTPVIKHNKNVNLVTMNLHFDL